MSLSKLMPPGEYRVILISLKRLFVGWDLPCVAVVDRTFKFTGICLFKSSGTNVLESTTFLTTSITLIFVLHLKKIHYVNTIHKCERYTKSKVSKYGVFSGPYFLVIRPEKTPYLDTFHKVILFN